MPWPLVDIAGLLPPFILVVARLSGIMLAAPLFGGRTIPGKVKAALVLSMGMMVFPIVFGTLPQRVTMAVALWGMPGELLVGLVLGLGLNIILISAQMTGMIVGQQAGLSMASVVDPNTDVQTSVVGEMYFFVTMTIFLILGGHRELLRALLDSFATVPVLGFEVDHTIVDLLTTLLMSSLVMAFRVSGPAVIALLLAKMTLGFLSRTMPQLHILSVGFAVFVCVGMLLAGLGVEPLLEVTRSHLDHAIGLLRTGMGLNAP
jgi:flagellar biosynthetic protein FliR